MRNLIRVKKLNKKAVIPTKGTPDATGLDLTSTQNVVIKPGEIAVVGTGLSADLTALPQGSDLQVRPRSGLAAKYGVTVLNAPGTIDRDYQGEIKVILINHGKTEYEVKEGDRIAQLVLSFFSPSITFAEVKELTTKTMRDRGGFGSTGR